MLVRFIGASVTTVLFCTSLANISSGLHILHLYLRTATMQPRSSSCLCSGFEKKGLVRYCAQCGGNRDARSHALGISLLVKAVYILLAMVFIRSRMCATGVEFPITMCISSKKGTFQLLFLTDHRKYQGPVVLPAFSRQSITGLSFSAVF